MFMGMRFGGQRTKELVQFHSIIFMCPRWQGVDSQWLILVINLTHREEGTDLWDWACEHVCAAGLWPLTDAGVPTQSTVCPAIPGQVELGIH